MCNLQKRLIRAAFWLLLQAMFMSDWKQTTQQRWKLQKRLLTINKRKIIRWNIYRDNNFHSRRQVLKCLWNPCLCFKPASRCLRFSKMNSRQENRSKLSFTARIITKYSLERFLSTCGEKMSEGFLKFSKLMIKPDTRSDHCLKS